MLVNKRISLLKLAHQTLGRYIIALAIDAVQNRPGTARNTWHPVFIVIDEFQECADEYKTPEMLRLIREYNAGAILAHHNMYPTECNDGIRSAISTNTGIKYASDPRGMDINYMARDMQCEAGFLTKQCKKSETHARFGTLLRWSRTSVYNGSAARQHFCPSANARGPIYLESRES